MFLIYSCDNYGRILFRMDLSQNLHKIVRLELKRERYKKILCKFCTKRAQKQLVRKQLRESKIMNAN